MKHDGDINIADEYGHTALMLAADKGNIEMVEFLIVNGAKTEIKSKAGVRAVEMACNQDIVKIISDARNPEYNKSFEYDAATRSGASR